MAKSKPLPVPDGLSPAAARIWEDETAESSRAKPGRALLLEQALRAFDRWQAYRGRIESEGATFTTKTTGAVHVNPLVRLEAVERGTFIKLAKLLDLERQNWSSYS